MPRFFIDNIDNDNKKAYILGEDAKHISKSLRMHTGEKVTLCDCKGYDYICTIISINDQYVEVNINDIVISKSEPNITVILYQGLPKGDKMDTIIQKAVELGISEIVPVLTNRCVSRPDEKSANKKCQRWQKISLEAAKQSGRGIIPHINNIITFKEMIKRINCNDQTIIFYEQGGQSLSNILNSSRNNINIIIGPEGGFEKYEVEQLSEIGANIATLGPRILRTETAGIAAISAIMYATGNMV